MDETSDEVLAISDVDAGDDNEGTTSPTPATVPKKRGRPSNAEKPKKAATSVTGRGRGRPAKGSEAVNKKVAKNATSDGSEDEGTASDGGSPALNGDSADGEAAVPSKRGRKPKVKRKLPNPIEATGKGRGRPKKMVKTSEVEDDDEAADDDDEGESNDKKSGKKSVAKKAKKGRGRPKKINNSDDESSDDKERRPVGRPPSGGINLNIVRTGKGQGRPKNSTLERRAAKKAAESENMDGKAKKTPGRPLTSGKGPYLPTGKPRGRPKAAMDNESQNEGEISELSLSMVNESSAGEENTDHVNGESVEAC